MVLPLLVVFLSNSLWGYLPLSRDVAKVPYYVQATSAMRSLQVSVLRAALIVQTRLASAQDLARTSPDDGDLASSFSDVSHSFAAVRRAVGEWPAVQEQTYHVYARWLEVREQARALIGRRDSSTPLRSDLRITDTRAPALGEALPDGGASGSEPADNGLALRLAAIDDVPGGVATADLQAFDSGISLLSARIEDMIAVVSNDVNARLDEGRRSSQRVYGLTISIGLMVIMFIMYVNIRLARYVVDPVNGIVGSIADFRSGDYSARTGVNRRDEIGALADAFNDMAANIEQTHAHLSSLTERDPLTGMLNRRGFDPRFDRHLQQAEVANRELAIIMVDVDHFKKVNDSHGHAVGDDVLVAVSDTIRNCLRAGDFSARLGGEEFVVCLPDEGRETGLTVAERLREAVSRVPFVDNDGNEFSVTISAGVAVYPECGRSRGEILQRGDEALYAAKSSGRNRIQLACANDAWRKAG
ncbi:diguanylate cyclase (GGDEF)-like protein [Breoghania corrubedonensis]|uniref:diguanylate cyclase n=1 Tax=Breoghania corrubedonensis TaxID=665038 RepID=A0A2T5UW89_9HYPH|nr:diguanylate cyclase (GGDEF)-like protein [Breoghania corrubedonensis]